MLGALSTSTYSFFLSSAITEPGASLTVGADHLPANQVGQIQLQSQLYSFWFRADGGGAFTESITIPLDIGIGDHLTSLCWGNSCRLHLPLTVVAPGTLPSPTGSSPTTNPSPSPTPTHAAFITLSPTCGRRGTSVTVRGFYFTLGQAEAVTFTDVTTMPEGSATVQSNGTFTRIFTVPLLAVIGNATVRVNGSNGLFSATFKVTLLSC